VRLRPIDVEVGRVSLRPAQLDHLIGARLSQVGGQVNFKATELGEVLTLLGILALAVFEPEFGLEALLLTPKVVLAFP
jgi:hypothetical protein